jgi:hypothetical protein
MLATEFVNTFDERVARQNPWKGIALSMVFGESLE